MRAGRARWRVLGALALVACGVGGGCRAKGQWSEADELRQQLDAAQREVTRLTAERDEARAKLAEAERVRLGGADLPRDAAEALPRCAAVEIDRLSGLDGSGGVLDVYVRPLDGRRRFVQVVGTMEVRADALPAASSRGESGRVLATASFGPAALREAYRSSALGTHYALKVPLSGAPLPSPGGDRVVVTVEFRDALSGQVFRADRVMAVGAK